MNYTDMIKSSMRTFSPNCAPFSNHMKTGYFLHILTVFIETRLKRFSVWKAAKWTKILYCNFINEWKILYNWNIPGNWLMAVYYLTTAWCLLDDFLPNALRMSTRQLSDDYLTNACGPSDDCLKTARQLSNGYLTNTCRLSNDYLKTALDSRMTFVWLLS